MSNNTKKLQEENVLTTGVPPVCWLGDQSQVIMQHQILRTKKMFDLKMRERETEGEGDREGEIAPGQR